MLFKRKKDELSDEVKPSFDVDKKTQENEEEEELLSPKEDNGKISLASDETIEFQVFRKLTGGAKRDKRREAKLKEEAIKRANVERFKPDIKLGLSSEMVEHRIKDGLTNSTPKKYTSSIPKILLKNFLTYFNILMFAMAIVLIIVQSSISNFFFAFIALANLIIGTVQEIRSKIVTDRMSLIVSPKATVIRNGTKIEVNESDLVLDDIVIISSGHQVGADCIVKDGLAEANESMQTGESKPVRKVSGDRLLAGSFIVSGTVTCQVESVGEDSFSGKIQKTAKTYSKTTSPLNRTINGIIQVISLLVLPLGLLMGYVNYRVTMHDNVDTLTFINSVVEKTFSSIIGMIPSGLVLLTSVALTVGVIRLAKKKVLIQDLYSIERLARVDCICFDKTGTLTDGTLKVERAIKLDSKFDDALVIGNYLSSFKETNQTSLALLNEYKPNHELAYGSVVPFSSDRKYSIVSFSNGKTYALGAPEYLLDLSKHDEILDTITKAQQEGFRALIFCEVGGIKDNRTSGKVYPKMLFILSDHIRDDAKDTIKWFNDNNVNIKVISGDSPITVSEIAKRCGIIGAEKYVSLEGLSINETMAIADKYTIFGRVSPEQKAALIKSLRAKGSKVAMTGDGVNDILAMKQADCAIAMASGADAARSAAHVVLLNSDFGTMPSIVGEGRRVVNNIQLSASLFTMKTFFTILLSLSIDILYFCNIRVSYPFSPKNLVVLEMIPIGLSAFFLALQPNNNLIKGNLGHRIIFNSLPGALAMFISVFCCVLMSYYGVFDKHSMVSLSILCLNTAAFIMLFKICWPFNLYRTILYTLSLTAAFCILYFFNLNTFGINFDEITSKEWVIYGVMCAIMVVIISVSWFVISLVEKKEDKQLTEANA